MAYQSPKILNTYGFLVGLTALDINYTNPITRVTLRRSVSTMFIDEKAPGPGKKKIVSFNKPWPSNEQMIHFIAMEEMIRSCASNAEEIKNLFLNINLDIPLSQAELDKHLNIYKLDFMQLKERFMNFIKADEKIKTIELYSSNTKMKLYRQNLNQFILDRNKYTHGIVHMLLPDFKPVLEYIDPSHQYKEFASVDEPTLIGYNHFYTVIKDLVRAFRSTRLQ